MISQQNEKEERSEQAKNNQAKDFNRHSTKEDIWTANKPVKDAAHPM